MKKAIWILTFFLIPMLLYPNASRKKVKYKLSNITNFGTPLKYHWVSLAFLYDISNEISLKGYTIEGIGTNSKSSQVAIGYLVVKMEKSPGFETFFTFMIHYAVEKPVWTFTYAHDGLPATITYNCTQTGENWKAEMYQVSIKSH